MVTILFLFLFVTVAFYIVCYCWSKRRQYFFANSLPGPRALPIVGNGLYFRGHHNDLLRKIEKLIDEYPHPMRIWLGQNLIIGFSDPSQIGKIMNSTKITHKHDTYRFLQTFLGDGLISSSGEKWKTHRRLLQPLINLKYVQESVNVFNKHTDLFVRRLNEHVDKEKFDILHYVHDFCTDIISESVLGNNLQTQEGKNEAYNQAFNDMYEVIINRFAKPWLHVDFIFNFTKYKKLQEIIKSTMKKYTVPMMENAKKNVQSNNLKEYVPLIQKIAEIIVNIPNCMSDEDYFDHMVTFFAASEDTVATAGAFACLCFGMYPDKQEKAFEELKFVLKTSDKEIVYEDLSELKYLEMCIKEVLRLFPIASYILRKTTSDFIIDQYTIPTGCCILIPIFRLHRSPKYWEKPDEFYPEHFLPDVAKKRNNFVYMPFSAGPRGCIGKMFAYAALKILLANLIKHYEILADGKCKDIELSSDISVRSINGYKVQLKKRSWT